jgi:hypothetical protein
VGEVVYGELELVVIGGFELGGGHDA